MNKHKVGRPLIFPGSHLEFLPFVEVRFGIPYRMMDGAVDAVSESINGEAG